MAPALHCLRWVALLPVSGIAAARLLPSAWCRRGSSQQHQDDRGDHKVAGRHRPRAVFVRGSALLGRIIDHHTKQLAFLTPVKSELILLRVEVNGGGTEIGGHSYNDSAKIAYDRDDQKAGSAGAR